MVSYPDDGTTPPMGLMISADGAMFRSKRAGKNRVTGVPMAPDLSASPSPGDPGPALRPGAVRGVASAGA